MKTGFKNELSEGNYPEMYKKSPWDFTCPSYDQRTSCFLNAGTHQGVGKKAPVGSIGGAKESNVIPKGRVKTLEVDEKG